MIFHRLTFASLVVLAGLCSSFVSVAALPQFRSATTAPEVNTFKGSSIAVDLTDGVVDESKDIEVAPSKNKKKRSPFGLPGIVQGGLYGHLDFVPYIFISAFFSKVLSGTASKAYAVFGIFHTVMSFFTVYDKEAGSLFQRWTGIQSLGIPLKFHYVSDVLSTITFFFLPDFVDGYDDSTKLMAKLLSLGGLTVFPFTHVH